MKDSSMRSALIGCLVFLPVAFGLAACGGGGGSSGSAPNPPDSPPAAPILPEPPEPPEPPDFPLDRDSVRTRIGGSPLNLNSEQITAEIKETIGTSDFVLASNLLIFASGTYGLDFHFIFPDGIGDRWVEASCFGFVRCLFVDLLYSNSAINISDFGGADEYQAIAIRNGVSLFQARSSDVEFFEFKGENRATIFFESGFEYGGWLDYSGFAVNTLLNAKSVSHPVEDISRAVYGISIGSDSGTRPTGSGTATWTGVMVGGDVSSTSTRGNMIQGDAGITVDFGRRNVDVNFTNVVDLDTGRSRRDMDWTNLRIDLDGTFDDRGFSSSIGRSGNNIHGRFYGPNHEEVGGTFERDQIIGAFGAKRD